MSCRSCYIHIPFCKTICSYCDFCKQFYSEPLADSYLESLAKEIKHNYRGEMLETLYIGGGTPSILTLSEWEKLFQIIQNFSLSSNYEFTIEANIDDLCEEKISFWKKHGVNRLSIGIETMHPKFLSLLERNHKKKEVIENITLAKKYFPNINIDLMYAFPKETLKDLKEDLEWFLSLHLPHISIYSLILEPHTKLYLKKIVPIKEELEARMYAYIQNELEKNDYVQYEISNFAKKGYESRHNLTYWNNEEYYGFGLGAGGYIGKVRYLNTRSMKQYQEGKIRLEEEKITKQVDMENEMMLGLRKVEGVEKEHFFHKFGIPLEEKFDIINLIGQKCLIEENGKIKIPKEKLYISNSILVHFIGGSSE